MRVPGWLNLSAGPEAVAIGGGRALRLLRAQEVLEARREAEGLAQEGRERALCRNACLLARALVRRGKPVYGSGAAVLEALTVEQIQTLAGQWAAFSKEADPGLESGQEWVDALNKAWSTRRRSGCGGVCCEPSGPCRLRNGWEGCASGTTSGAR